MTRVRLAHLASHPIQYFAPLYREVARRSEIDLTVYFYSAATAGAYFDPGFGREVAWDVPLLDGFRHRFLPSAHRTDLRAAILKRPNLDIVREATSPRRYDALWVNGYSHSTTWLAVAAARGRGLPVLIRDEQTLLHSRPAHKRVLKSLALGLLYRHTWGLSIGVENSRYLEHYGMPSSRITRTPYAVDNEYFSTEAELLAPQRAQLRCDFGIEDDAPVILFSGKLIEKKQPARLLDAFERLSSPAWLLFAGDGPLRGALAQQAGSRVRFAGFLNQSELPRAYAVADLFVLPSMLHETWGLVVNEALNFGLPVVVTDKVGSAADLVRDGENGFVVPWEDTNALTDALQTLVADAGLRERFGARGRKIVAEYSIAAAADGIVHAALAAVDPAGRG